MFGTTSQRDMVFPNRINPIIKLTERCNYACEFCRYSKHRQTDDGISEKLVKKIILESHDYNVQNGLINMNVIFHGGEPLLYGAKRLLALLDDISNSITDGFVIDYSIQTNASLISDEWIQIFKKYDFNVGISLDGPISLNGHFGSNQDSAVDNAINAYHIMKKEKIHCGFLSVITDKHLDELTEFFDFYMKNKIESIGLCYCYNKFDGDSVDPVELGQWLIKLYDLYFNAPYRISIREFDMVTRRVLKHPHNECSMSCRESCGSYITLTPKGLIEFCDDYDLDYGRKNAIGDLNNNSLTEIISSEKYQKAKAASIEILYRKCKKCEVFELCRCGCPRSDTNGENYFCDTFKIIYPHIQKKVLEYLEKR